jgi:hypothetical protein
MLLNKIKAHFSKIKHIESVNEKILVNQCLLHSKSNRNKSIITSLSDIEFSGFSQAGEDGILDWLIEKLPDIPKSFVEFGVEDYRESNTRLILWLRNWYGLVIDGSEKHVNDIRIQNISYRFDLDSLCAFITAENINELIRSRIKGDVGLLSIDIDGNDYWVWKSIDVISPVIVVCEFNSVFGDLKSISIPYKDSFQRTQAHYSNLYFGASLSALINLARIKGYVFVGTNTNGSNAFFVRVDRAPEVINSIQNIEKYNSKFRESRDISGNLTFVRARDRFKIIRHLPIFDFDTQTVKPLSELEELYSPSWY